MDNTKDTIYSRLLTTFTNAVQREVDNEFPGMSPATYQVLGGQLTAHCRIATINIVNDMYAHKVYEDAANNG